MRIIKRPLTMLLGLVVTVLLLSSAVAVAASYSPKKLQCPRCTTYNYSYGYNPEYSSLSDKALSGEYCIGCGKVVASGQYHAYIYTSDLYYFMCSSSTCKKLSITDRTYSKLYANPVSEHHIYNYNE